MSEEAAQGDAPGGPDSQARPGASDWFRRPVGRGTMLFYDLFYLVLLTLMAPYILYRVVTTPRYRAGLRQRFGGAPTRSNDRPCVWVHGVSVGEILAARRFIQELSAEFSGWEVVVSTTTDTGYEVATRNFPDNLVFFFPLDLGWAVNSVLDRVRPRLIILIELEIWPNFLAHCYQRDIPVVLVNGRISERSYKGYRLVKQWLFRPLARIRRYLVQTELYAKRFRDLGVPARQVMVTGSMKNDNVPDFDPAERGPAVRRELGIDPGATLLTAGSIHEPEEDMLLAAYLALRVRHPGLRLLLAPRHLERVQDVEAAVRRAGLEPSRRSARHPGAAPLASGEVLVLDTIGELVSIYAASDLVFVGGSLVRHGGQNMMEPASLGRPTVFGPWTENFRESVDQLLDAGGAVRIEDPRGLEPALARLLERPDEARSIGERGREAVLANRGATRRTLDVLHALVRSPSEKLKAGLPAVEQ